MFSQNLYDALCQNQKSDEAASDQPADDSTVMEAIERAMATYQRLFVTPDSAS